MSEYKCPFSIVQATGTCHCHHSREVIRRGGSEFDCTDPAAHTACSALTQHMNAVALPTLGYEDDLTLTPKSVYERILLGGLQGLRMAQNAEDSGLETTDIWSVVAAAQARYASMERIPASDFVPVIATCSIKKRRHRRG